MTRKRVSEKQQPKIRISSSNSNSNGKKKKSAAEKDRDLDHGDTQTREDDRIVLCSLCETPVSVKDFELHSRTEHGSLGIRGTDDEDEEGMEKVGQRSHTCVI